MGNRCNCSRDWHRNNVGHDSLYQIHLCGSTGRIPDICKSEANKVYDIFVRLLFLQVSNCASILCTKIKKICQLIVIILKAPNTLVFYCGWCQLRLFKTRVFFYLSLFSLLHVAFILQFFCKILNLLFVQSRMIETTLVKFLDDFTITQLKINNDD